MIAARQVMPLRPLALIAALGAIAIALPPTATVALAIVALVAWLAFARTTVALGALAFVVPLQDAVSFSLGPTSATPARLVALALAAGWGLRWLDGRARLRLTPPVAAWGAYTAWLALTIPVAVDRDAWASEVWRWGIGLVILAIATDTLRTPADARPLIAGTAAALMLTVAAAVMQVAQADGPPTHVARGLLRASTWFGEPNPLAGWVELGAPLLIALLVGRGAPGVATAAFRGRVWRASLLLASAAGCAIIVLTQSRGGALGFAAALAVIGLMATPTTRRATLVAVGLAGALALGTDSGRTALDTALSTMRPTATATAVTPATWSVEERLAHMRAGVAMARANPLLGVGAGNFDARYREFTPAWRFRIPRGHAHNGWAQAAAQGGVGGLLAFSAILLLAGRRAWRGARTSCGEARALAIGSLAVVVALGVHGLFDHLHGLGLNFTIALAIACAEPARRSTAGLVRPTSRVPTP